MPLFDPLPPPPALQDISEKGGKVSNFYGDWFFRLWQKLKTLTVLPPLGSANQFLTVDTTGSDLEYKTLSGTTNEVNIAFSAGSAVLSTGFATNYATLTIHPVSSGTDSIAVGEGAIASGTASVAIGVGATATNTNGIAFGAGATSLAANAITIGFARNSGQASISIAASPSLIDLGAAENCVHIGTYRNAGQPFGVSGPVNNFLSLGTGNNADFAGECSWSQGNFVPGFSGSAKVGSFPMRAQTQNANLTNLGTSTGNNPTGVNPSGQIVLANNSCWTFDVDIIARRTDADGTNASWKLQFAAKRDANAASTALIGQVAKTIVTKDAGAATWDVGVAVDTGSGAVYPTVTGEAGKTIRWVANVKFAKVMES